MAYEGLHMGGGQSGDAVCILTNLHRQSFLKIKVPSLLTYVPKGSM